MQWHQFHHDLLMIWNDSIQDDILYSRGHTRTFDYKHIPLFWACLNFKFSVMQWENTFGYKHTPQNCLNSIYKCCTYDRENTVIYSIYLFIQYIYPWNNCSIKGRFPFVFITMSIFDTLLMAHFLTTKRTCERLYIYISPVVGSTPELSSEWNILYSAKFSAY